MEQNKSPFEEIFKKEESRKKEEKEKKAPGILDALDNEEKSFFEGSTDSEAGSIEKKGGNVSKEKRYIKLLNELVEKKYYEEAIGVIGEMKAEFGK